MRPRSLPLSTDGWTDVLQQSPNTRTSLEEQWHSRDSSQSTTTSSISLPTSAPTLTNSASSLLSVASSYDHPTLDSTSISCHKKTWSQLPDVAEEPVERDYPGNTPDYAATADLDDTSSPAVESFSRGYSIDQSESFYTFGPEYSLEISEQEHDEGRLAKRRRSADAMFNGFASRMVQRLPSFARRNRGDRKRSFTSMSHRRSEEVASPTFGARPASFALSSGRTCADGFGGSIDLDRYGAVITPDLVIDDASYEAGEHRHELEPLEESTEPMGRVSTPLLHPLMVDIPDEPPIQSPLQSPTIATYSVGVSVSNTPAGTPRIVSQITPPLSTKPSVSSVHRSRAGTLIPSSEIPPIVIAENDDPWSDRLGHANFHIYPEPYLPEQCNAASCTQLVKDWNIARTEFSKHLARTEMHFGANSRTYRMTEDKWAEIEVNWRASHDLALRRAKQNGDSPPPDMAIQPGPVPKVPIMHGSCHDAKFPNLGDTDIVGLMDRGPPLVMADQVGENGFRMRKASKSRRASLIKFLNSISLPGSKSSSK